MSNKMASKAKKQAEPDQNTPEAAEAASLDAAQQTIKTLMKLGKERGFVTHDEALPYLQNALHHHQVNHPYSQRLGQHTLISLSQLLLLYSLAHHDLANP